jgi:tryptophan 2,3-dioxygenase
MDQPRRNSVTTIEAVIGRKLGIGTSVVQRVFKQILRPS